MRKQKVASLSFQKAGFPANSSARVSRGARNFVALRHENHQDHKRIS